MQELIIIEVDNQPIELCKLLKIANLVGGGGEAKMVISEGYVGVNGEVAFQKRKKIYHDDVIEFNGEFIQMHVVKSLGQAELIPPHEIEVKATQPKNKKKKSIESKQKSSPVNKELNVTKRKPINF